MRKDWISIRGGEIFYLSSERCNANDFADGFPCVELDCLSQGTGVITHTIDISETNGIKNKFSCGQVLYGKLRPYLCKYAHPNFDGACSTEIWVLDTKDKTKLLRDYLFYLVQSEKFKISACIMAGTKMPRSSWDIIEATNFILPSIAEQRKIVDILADVDAAIFTAEMLSEKADEALKKYRNKIFSIHSDWVDKERLVGDVFDICIGGTPSRKKPLYWTKTQSEGYPWASISDLNHGLVMNTNERITEIGKINSSAKIIPADTVLMSFKLTIGRIAVSGIDLCTNEGIAAFFPKNEWISSTNTKHALSQIDWLVKTDQAVKGKTLNKKKIQEFNIRLVKRELQTKAEQILKSAEEFHLISQKRVSSLKKLKCGLMRKLLTGKFNISLNS